MSDPTEARRAADEAALAEALSAVEAAASEEWKRLVRRCIEWLAETRPDGFIVDDIWDAMTEYYPQVVAREPRALGPIVKSAVAEGVIEPTGRWVNSTRRHKSPVWVYRRRFAGDE